jgi:four helix bundle protein
LVSRRCDLARPLEPIIAKRIAAEAKPNFISKCGDSLRELEETGYWLELLVDGKIVEPTKLSALRQECDELIAIFVTILKRSKAIS